MRFGLVHRVMTDALATLGILAVVSTATMSFWHNVALLAGLAIALAIPESWQQKPTARQLAQAAYVALIALEIFRLAVGKPMLDVAVEFAALLQIVRIATRRGAAHDQQIIVLALLHFVTGTVLGGSLAYALCFFGFVIVAPGALVLSHLRREVEGNYRQGARDRTGLPVDVPRILRSRRVVGKGFLAATCGMSIPIAFFTAILFICFPRIGLQILLLNRPRSDRMVGFSDHVDLGEVGELKNGNSAIALRFSDIPNLPNPPPAKYLLRMRGTAFDAYDGHAWIRTQSERHTAERTSLPDVFVVARPPKPGDEHFTIELEPLDPPVIFLPPHTTAVRTRVQQQAVMNDPVVVQKGPEGEFRYTGNDARGLRYEVFGAPPSEPFTETLSNTDRARYLSVPASLPTRVGLLAHEWTDGMTDDTQKAHAIETHLRKDFQYDMTAPSGGQKQPIDHFLFESKRGHCEFFSTAMAMMLREVGVPSRNVVGFVGGTYNRFGGYYAIREQDSHSWVEAYIDDHKGAGSWQTFEPTPASGVEPIPPSTGTLAYLRDVVEALSQGWNRHVVGYDLHAQVHLFEEISGHYERARNSAGLSKGVLGKITKAPVVAFAVLVAFFVAASRIARRRRATKPKADGPVLDKKLENVASLYRSLDGALSVQGIGRPLWVPPLKYAEELVARAHPLAPEVLDLTNLYLGARFGGEELNDSATRAFERRVREIRTAKRPPAERSIST